MATLNINSDPSRGLAPARIAPPAAIVRRGPVADTGFRGAPEFVGMDDLLTSMRRRLWTLLGFMAAGTLLAISIAIFQKPVYESHALIEIQGLNENFLNRRDLEPNVEFGALLMDTYLQTQIKIIQTESLAGRVVDRLQLLGRNEYREQPGHAAALLRAIGLGSLPAAQVSKDSDPRQTAIQTALKNLTVRVAGQTRLVELMFEAGDPALASSYINTLIDEYIAETTEGRARTSRQTGELLAGQLQDLKAELDLSEKRLQDFAVRNGLVFTSEKDTVAEARLRQLQVSLSAAQDARTSEQSRYEMALHNPPDSLPDVLDSQTLRSYQVNLTDLRRQLADLSAVLTPSHYKVRQVAAQIDELQTAANRERGNIQSRIKNQYEAALRRQRLLEDAYADQLRIAATQAAKSVRYDSLKREVDMRRLLYEATLQRVKEAGVAAAIRSNNVRVVDPANPPRKPIRPNRPLDAAIRLLAGTFLGVGFVLFSERRKPDARISGDLRARLQMPELGIIPSADAAGTSRQRTIRPPWVSGHGEPTDGESRATGNWLQLVTWRERDSALAESFRGTLASLLFSVNNGSAPRVMVITSAAPGEGKTTIATNLAIALAATNRRVLLIDGNRRNPRLHDIFHVPNTWGFSDLLRSFTPCDEYAGEDLAIETEIPGLSVLPNGSNSANVLDLLYDHRTAEMMGRFRAEFDAILIDTPPVLTHADARALGKLADGVALVIRAGQKPFDSALAAWSRLNEDGVHGLGTILNDFRADS
ncbi:MAG: GumC family protein [Bryobacteraceae bacterium]